MRSLRLLTVVGLSIGTCALAASSASACILDSAGATSSSGGTVRPGDLVRITMHAIGTDESPGASPYVITANGVEIANGRATPDANNEWTGAVTASLDALGSYNGPVRIVVTLTDSFQQLPVPTSIEYDGTPVTPQPQTTASETVNPPAPAAQQTPEPAAKPVTRPGGDPTSRARTRTNRAQPSQGSRPAPRAPARAKSGSPALRTPQRSHLQAPAPEVRRALDPAPAALTTVGSSQPTARAVRRPHRTKIDRPASLEARAISRRVATDPPTTSPRTRPAATAAAPATAATQIAALLLLALLMGGLGLAGVALRRRNPIAPEPPDRLAELEAELQELLAEERLRTEIETAEPRASVTT